MPIRRPRPPASAVTVVAALAVVMTACGTTATDGATAPAASVERTFPASTAAGGAGTTTPDPAVTAPPASATTRPPLPAPDRFAPADAALRQRVSRAGIAGGYLVVLRDGDVVHDQAVGRVGPDTVLSVASAAKWLTAATAMTLVDEGALTLDNPIARWLPEFSTTPDLTLRHLLTHRSGLRDAPCIWQTGADMAACVATVARTPVEFPAGTRFSYGNASFHVAGRLVEVVTGQPFDVAFRQRLGDPLGMTATSFPGRNPSPAAGLRTSARDYGRFLRMVLDGGTVDGRRLLSTLLVDEMQRNQVVGFDTSRDHAVGITRIPTYGFGLWRDRPDAADRAIVVSGNGALGFYPWIDHGTGTYGVLAVEDHRGAEVAVPASRTVVDATLAAFG